MREVSNFDTLYINVILTCRQKTFAATGGKSWNFLTVFEAFNELTDFKKYKI